MPFDSAGWNEWDGDGGRHESIPEPEQRSSGPFDAIGLAWAIIAFWFAAAGVVVAHSLSGHAQ